MRQDSLVAATWLPRVARLLYADGLTVGIGADQNQKKECKLQSISMMYYSGMQLKFTVQENIQRKNLRN